MAFLKDLVLKVQSMSYYKIIEGSIIAIGCTGNCTIGCCRNFILPSTGCSGCAFLIQTI